MTAREDNGGAVVVRDDRATAAAVRSDEASIASDISPMALIRFAIESKTPAGELKELVTLAEHVEERNARKEFFAALRRFQQACPPIKKNKTAKIATKGGGSYSFKYAELDEIERHVKPYLEAEDLSYNFSTAVDDKGVLLTNTCTLRHIGGHAEQSHFTLPTSSESAMTAQQRFSAANNFAKRQTLPAILGISTTDKEIADDEVDPAKISDDQATEIEDLLRESGAGRAKFLGYFDAETVADIRAANYGPAIAMLKDIAKRKGARS